MNLTQEPETVHWPSTHYIFIEKSGPFQNSAPESWNNLHKLVPDILKNNKITGYTSLYKFKPAMTYRAGVSVADKPGDLPRGLAYELFEGGKYAQFVLTGPYSDLPEACGIVFKTVEDKKMKTRDGAFYIENYVNDPTQLVSGEQPIIQILIPIV